MKIENSAVSVVYAEVTGNTAEEQDSRLQLFYINTDTCMYTEANENSEAVRDLTVGNVAVVIEESGSWTRVRVGEQEGYVKTVCLQMEHPDTAVWEEMDDLEEYNTAFINEIGRLAAEKRRSRIFGAIIIVLIVAIFGVGIFSTLRKHRREEDAER